VRDALEAYLAADPQHATPASEQQSARSTPWTSTGPTIDNSPSGAGERVIELLSNPCYVALRRCWATVPRDFLGYMGYESSAVIGSRDPITASAPYF